MKKIVFFKVKAVLLVFTMLGMNVQAKTVYLSSSGNDAQSGLDETQAVTTLAKAISLCADDDVIMVDGTIDLSKELTGNMGFAFPDIKVTIEGKDKSTSGFTGNTKTRLLSFAGNSKTVILKNLILTKGRINAKGALLSIVNSDVRIENCELSEASGRIPAGGAVHLLNCKNFTLKNSVIKNCSASEGGAIYMTEDGSIKNLTSVIYIESCLIAGNSGYGGGAAISIYNPVEGNTVKFTMVNSTVYNNKSDYSSKSGAIAFNSAQNGSTANFTNCTIVKNNAANTNKHGAGISFLEGTESMIKGIYNCIIESNVNGSSKQKADITFKYLPENEKTFFLYNSYIGGINIGDGIYESIKENNNRTDYLSSGLAELATPHDNFIASQNNIPLEYNSSARYHGNPQYLKNMGITADQNGNERTFENNKCAIGAVEKTTLPPVGVVPQVFQQFIMYGQSLSTGHESYPMSMENIEGNYMIGEQIWINYGNKNFDKLTPLRAAKSLGLFELSEVALHGTVNHIRLKQREDSPEIENKFIATSAGESGRSIEDLSKESQLFDFYKQFLASVINGKKIASQTNSKISVPAVFWLQGEWNYHEGQTDATGLTAGSKATNDKNEYKKLMLRLKDNMQEEIQTRYLQDEKPLFITYQVGAQYTRGKQLSIGMAQLEASNEYKDVVCAGPVYPMTDFGGHLDGNGYRWYGEMMGKVYYKTKILGEDFRPLQPKKLERDSENAKKIRITFHVPELPLVLDTKILKKENNYGFNLYLNGNLQTISGVEIVDDSVVVLTCAANLTGGTVAVSYAAGNTGTNGHGNLRDSDPYKAFFNYEFPDKKDENGEFVFDHTYDPVWEIPEGGYGRRHRYTLIPKSGEPLGDDGKPIYDQPYPLYNFSVAFYYEIPQNSAEFTVPNWSGLPNRISHETKTPDIGIYQSDKTLYINLPAVADTSVAVYDISGKALMRFENSSQAQKYPLQAFPAGVYIVKVSSEGQTKTAKLIL